MKRRMSMMLALLLVMSALLPAVSAQASGEGWYVVESTSPYGYCYLYSRPSDIEGRNLGRYDNGSLVYVWDYYGGQQGKWNYCHVESSLLLRKQSAYIDGNCGKISKSRAAA